MLWSPNDSRERSLGVAPIISAARPVVICAHLRPSADAVAVPRICGCCWSPNDSRERPPGVAPIISAARPLVICAYLRPSADAVAVARIRGLSRIERRERAIERREMILAEELPNEEGEAGRFCRGDR